MPGLIPRPSWLCDADEVRVFGVDHAVGDEAPTSGQGFDTREIGWQVFFIGLVHAVMSGLPVWAILATLAALAFWYGPENLKIILLLCLLTIVAMMAPGDAHAAAKADLKDLTDHEEEYF